MVKVAYGGSDCSCKHIEVKGCTVTCKDLLDAIEAARANNLMKICITACQFESLIKELVDK